MQAKYKIGVVGYSRNNFDHDEARKKLEALLLPLVADRDPGSIEIVSGFTNTGIPRIAYLIADDHGLPTVGFSAERALSASCGTYPVRKRIIVGENYGDESEDFIEYIDALVRVGGGKQSHHEVALFKAFHAEKGDAVAHLHEDEIELEE